MRVNVRGPVVVAAMTATICAVVAGVVTWAAEAHGTRQDRAAAVVHVPFRPAAAQTSAQNFPSVGVTLSAPPATASPTVSAQAAVAAVDALGIRPDVLADTVPQVRLALFTDGDFPSAKEATVGPDDATHVNVLAWAVTYPNAPVVVYGGFNAGATDGSSQTAGNCDLTAIVDAQSKAVLTEFQDCS